MTRNYEELNSCVTNGNKSRGDIFVDVAVSLCKLFMGIAGLKTEGWSKQTKQTIVGGMINYMDLFEGQGYACTKSLKFSNIGKNV